MIDTHCHLHDAAFDPDRDDVVARARAAGLSTMVTIGEDLEDSRRAIAVAERYEISAAAGVHPHQAAHAPPDLDRELRALLDGPGVVAIGETGLDYHYEHSPKESQAAVLHAQLRVARQADFPVIFHQRDAFDDFTAILREEWKPGMRGVVHCFTGTEREARILVNEFDLFLGIGGVLTFPKAAPLQEAVVAVGAARLLLETDCPYLAPVPVRGKRNEPSFVKHTAAKLAELLGMPLDRLVATTDASARRLFEL